MKKKILLGLGIVAVIAMFIGVYFLYGYLSENYAPENNLAGIENQNKVENEEKTKEDLGTETENTAENEEVSDDAENEETAEYEAPNFTVYDKDGNSVELWDLVGKPIVLNFWASWCGPCKAEMPHFEEAYKNNPDIEFIMVNATTSSYETLKKAQDFISDSGYTFPVYYDKDGQAAYLYGVSALPMTMLIDKDGAPIGYITGSISADVLNQLLEIARTGEIKELE